ncbi:sensor domain-containing diguanylate cyclase [Sporosarcina sp. 6E9]|uniref:sensor domain-containing diguanylate cyclase n=1 Tax=Sporosarcina sp. 6E9 TaxID=2819235 RepID=UPI001B30ABAF|nr:GGDEF domain-containing protein [Sporosarcina sp. 6E9]
MDVSKKQQIIMFCIWLLVVPASFLLAKAYFPAKELDWMNIVILLFIMFLTMLLPIHFENMTISLERWITLTIFLQYGLFVEIIFIQIAMFFILFTEKSTLPISHKFFVNSTIFAFTSLLSGTIYHALGGTIGSMDFSNVFYFGLIYAITYSLINNLLIKVYFHFNAHIFSLTSKGALWDYASTIIMVPFGVALYFLNVHLSNKSLLLIGIPFVIVLIVLRMYNSSTTLKDQLSSASAIGHELADRLLFDEVIETFLVKLKEVVPYDNAYVVDLRSGINFVPLMGNGPNGLTSEVKGLIFRDIKKADDGLDALFTRIYFNEKDIKKLSTLEFDANVRSVLTAPIIRDGVTEGFLIMTSLHKNMFQTESVHLINILTGFFAISLEKARFYESTIEKGERCGLTKLHNFSYLELKLGENMKELQEAKLSNLSVIMLDIDHFKSINDTYGHECGNVILVRLAELLRKFTTTGTTLARYGGEEFVFLLPNTTKEEAANLAEEIRAEVEKTNFVITPDLSEEKPLGRISIEVNITISLGVATAPEDADHPKDLLRNADRALYIGGKQSGRNLVGVYEDGEAAGTRL